MVIKGKDYGLMSKMLENEMKIEGVMGFKAIREKDGIEIIKNGRA